MQPVDTVIAARWIVPVEPAGRVLEDHALVIDRGRILDLCPTATARERYDARSWETRPAHVLLPGLVNAHTHVAMSLLRGLADDLPLSTWLNEHIWPAEGRLVNREFVRDGARLALREMLLGGTTCFADMYYFPDTVGDVAADAGMRAVLGLIVIEFPTPWAKDADEYLERGLALHDRIREHPLLHAAFAPHAPYTVADTTLSRVRRLADELELPIHMHVHETAAEVTDYEREHGVRPLAKLDTLGLVSPALMAVHMTQVTPDEVSRLAEAGASVVHCPRSNLKLASGFCPVADYAAAGVNLALGTDGAASNNRLDMLGELQVAALLAKGASGDPTALDAASALEMATLGGARALGLVETAGSLVPGKSADVIALDLSAPGCRPVLNVLSQIVYAAGREQVSDVWIAGRARVLKGALVPEADRALALSETQWAARVRQNDTTEANAHG